MRQCPPVTRDITNLQVPTPPLLGTTNWYLKMTMPDRKKAFETDQENTEKKVQAHMLTEIPGEMKLSWISSNFIYSDWHKVS
jgi:hypothetical protein